MPDLSNISHFPLKVIFAVHLILVTWGIQGHWCPKSAMLYNLLFFICLLWAVHNIESDEPLQFALSINVLSICFDIVTLSVYYPVGIAYASEKFSAAFMIINLIVRVATTIYLLRIGQARGGNLATMFNAGPATAIMYFLFPAIAECFFFVGYIFWYNSAGLRGHISFGFSKF